MVQYPRIYKAQTPRSSDILVIIIASQVQACDRQTTIRVPQIVKNDLVNQTVHKE